MERNAIHYTPRYFSCGMYFRFLPKPTRILSNFPSILELDSFSCPAREPWKLGALAGRPDLFSRKKNFSINHDRPGRSVFLNIFTTERSFQRKLSRVLQAYSIFKMTSMTSPFWLQGSTQPASQLFYLGGVKRDARPSHSLLSRDSPKMDSLLARQ